MDIEKGKHVTANIGDNLSWVTYDEGYKDVYDERTGVLLYSDGELLRIEGYNEEKGTVNLFKENIEEGFGIFEISLEQFRNDFVM